jgi:hypothetical protein
VLRHATIPWRRSLGGYTPSEIDEKIELCVTDTNHEALFTGGDVEAGNCKDRRGKFRRSWRGIKGKEMAGFGFSGSNSNVQSDESRD